MRNERTYFTFCFVFLLQCLFSEPEMKTSSTFREIVRVFFLQPTAVFNENIAIEYSRQPILHDTTKSHLSVELRRMLRNELSMLPSQQTMHEW